MVSYAIFKHKMLQFVHRACGAGYWVWLFTMETFWWGSTIPERMSLMTTCGANSSMEALRFIVAISLTFETTPRLWNVKFHFEQKAADLYLLRELERVKCNRVHVGVFNSIKVRDTLLFELCLFSLSEF